MNYDQDLLKYQIDLHYQSKRQSLRVFQEYLDYLLYALRKGLITGNSTIKETHIIKVICGSNSGLRDINIKGLKDQFFEYFQRNLYDFVYIPLQGMFLLKINY